MLEQIIEILSNEQIDEYYKEKCDYHNGKNEAQYDYCSFCYRFDVCKLALEQKISKNLGNVT